MDSTLMTPSQIATPEEAAESEAAWAAYVRGEDPGEPLEVVREELMAARRG